MERSNFLALAEAPSEPASDSRSTRAGSRRRLIAAVAPLCVLLLLWVWLFIGEGAFETGPNGKTLGGDMAMFMTASRVMKAGGNPYDPSVLYRNERSWLRDQHVQQISKRGVVRVGNPPLFFWLLRPLSDASFAVGAWFAIGVLALCSVLGLLLTLAYFRWSARLVPLLMFAMMPQVLLGPYYANLVPLVFLGIAGGLLASRRYPWLAGAALTLAWLKPPVALPLVLLVVLFLARDRLRVAGGFVGVSLLLFLLTLATTGPRSIGQWLHGLAGYSKDIASSPSVSSLSGLYVRVTSGGLRLGLELAGLAIAVALTALVWKWYRGRREVPVLAIAWLWFAWFLAAPYAHFYDEILLTAPVLALLGRNGGRLGERLPTTALYLLFFSLLFISWAPGGVQPLSLSLVLVAVMLYARAPKPVTSAP